MLYNCLHQSWLMPDCRQMHSETVVLADPAATSEICSNHHLLRHHHRHRHCCLRNNHALISHNCSLKQWHMAKIFVHIISVTYSLIGQTHQLKLQDTGYTATVLCLFICQLLSFSALTMLVGHQEEHPALKNQVMRY